MAVCKGVLVHSRMVSRTLPLSMREPVSTQTKPVRLAAARTITKLLAINYYSQVYIPFVVLTASTFAIENTNANP